MKRACRSCGRSLEVAGVTLQLPEGAELTLNSNWNYAFISLPEERYSFLENITLSFLHCSLISFSSPRSFEFTFDDFDEILLWNEAAKALLVVQMDAHL